MADGRHAMSTSAADGRPPDLSAEATSTLITTYFPFKSVSLNSFKPLPSYDDRNVYFTGTLENGERGEEPFVLKLYNCYTYTFEILEALNDVMLFLSARNFPCSCPLAGRDGRHAILVSRSKMLRLKEESDGAVEYTVKVVRFIPGVVMDKLDKCYLTPELSYSVGNMVGRMDLALQVNIWNSLECWPL